MRRTYWGAVVAVIVGGSAMTLMFQPDDRGWLFFLSCFAIGAAGAQFDVWRDRRRGIYGKPNN